MDKEEKMLQVYVKMLTALNELIEEDESVKDFVFNDTTEFMHVMMNMVPTNVFNRLTKDDKNCLEVNHIANRLCFQFGKDE